MKYTVGCVSDIGIKRTSNQDSFCYELATYQGHNIAFMVICDGMGGFSKGELASAEAVKTFDHWFLNRMPQILKAGFSAEALREEWYSMAENINRRISEYAVSHGLKMGTTLTADVIQLTHDHTVVQREIDSGNLSPADALHDTRQHILLQCLGAGRDITPDFTVGTIHPGSGYLLCSDGFRHKFSSEEMLQLAPSPGATGKKLEKKLRSAIEQIKARGETDNITCGLLAVT